MTRATEINKKRKDPAFLFYSNDFLTGTMLMTNEEVGKYIRLLCLQHQKGHLTKKEFFKIADESDTDLLSKFITDKNGNLYNSRLEEEAEKRSKYCDSRRNNRKKGKEDKKNICKTHVLHMENENENENINKNVNKTKNKNNYEKYPDFVTFWDNYKHGSKKEAFTEYLKTKDAFPIRDILKHIDIYKKETKEKRFMKHGCRYIKNRVWEDFIESQVKSKNKEIKETRSSNYDG